MSTTPEQAVVMAMALPSVVRSSHFDHDDFRVGKRIFMSFPQVDRITVHLEPEHARLLAESNPDAYILHPGVWGQRGWLRVILDQVEPDVVRGLIEDSWWLTAPKRLRGDLNRD